MEKRHRGNLELWKRILGIPIGTKVRLLRRMLPIADKGEKGTVVGSSDVRYIGKVYHVELESGCHLLLKEDELEIMEEEKDE